MKRKKNIIFAAFLLLLMCLLSACSALLNDTSLYIPNEAPLAAGDIDWNDLPESWTGNGKKVTDYFSDNYYESIIDNYPFTDEYSQNTDENGISSCVTKDFLNGLKNLTLQAEINERLQGIYDELSAETSFFDGKLTDEVKNGDVFDAAYNIWPNFTITGNILNIYVSRNNSIYSYDYDTGPIFSEHSEIIKTLNYDLSTGKELAFSDLFAAGTDLNALLNPMIAKKLSEVPYGGDWEYEPSEGITRPFRGLPNDYPYFTLREDALIIYFPDINPYTASAATVTIPIEAISDFLAQPVSQSSDYVWEETTFRMCYRTTEILEIDYSLENINAFGREELNFQPYILKNKSDDPIISKINVSLLDEYSKITNAGYPPSLPDTSDADTYRYVYNYLETNKPFVHMGVTTAVGDTNLMLHRYFDARTGALISLDELIINEDEVKQYLKENGITIDDFSNFYNFYTYLPGELYVGESNDPSLNFVPLSADIFNLERFK